MRKILCMLLMQGVSSVFAQQLPPVMTEEMAETQANLAAENGGAEVPDPEQEWRLDLNTNDVTDVLAFPLISITQAQAILKHREQFGRFLAVEELQVIDAFDVAEIRKIKPFLFCGRNLIDDRFHFNALLSAARHEIRMRFRRTLQDKVGYSDDGNYPFYRGDPNQINVRYRMQAGRYFSAGVVMEKDAGEPFLGRKNGGRMDFFSWHVYLKPERWLEAIAIGDYQVQFGQGLVAWKGLSLGKSLEVQQYYRRGAGIRPYASSGEAGFNRGLAFSLAAGKNFKIDGWTSFRRLDASLFPDDSTFFHFSVGSIQESGLHRSAEEMNDKAVLGHFLGGGHLQWEGRRLRQELTMQYQRFEFPLWPGDDPYEKFDASGREFLNAGWAWRYIFPNATIYSEIASDAQHDPALIAGVLFIPDRQWTISLHYRNFSRDYQCITCDALREGSKTQNEKGFLSGFIWQINPQLKWQAFLDYFQFPWLRYSSPVPSKGTEWQSQFTYKPARTTEVYLRFKAEEKPDQIAADVAPMPAIYKKRNVRFNLAWMADRDWEFQSRCEWTGVTQAGLQQQGILFYQELRCKPLGKAYSFSLRWSVFRTDSYDSRIYTYEQDMAGSFSLPAYAGTGFHYYFMLRYRLMKGLDAWVRYSVSVFPGTQQTAGSAAGRNEVKTQIRWQF